MSYVLCTSCTITAPSGGSGGGGGSEGGGGAAHRHTRVHSSLLHPVETVRRRSADTRSGVFVREEAIDKSLLAAVVTAMILVDNDGLHSRLPGVES